MIYGLVFRMRREYNIIIENLNNEEYLSIRYGGEFQLPLKRFPESSVSSLIQTGCCGRASRQQKLAPWVDNWLMAIIPLSG